MKLGLTANGKYNIIEGNEVLCQCATLTEAGAVLHYLNMKNMTMLERGIARTAILNWDNEVKEKQKLKSAKKAREKAHRKAKKTPSPDTGSPKTEAVQEETEGAVMTDVCHREEEKEEIRTETESGETVCSCLSEQETKQSETEEGTDSEVS